MQILAHRGAWRTRDERNCISALRRALELGFGLETDVRDHDGVLVIAHDPPSGAQDITVRDLIDLCLELGAAAPLAINIKADGLRELLGRELAGREPLDAFVFDMAVPDALTYFGGPAAVFTRQSEYEPQAAFYDHADGVWLDCFQRDWIDAGVIERHRAAGKRVALVSPELHGREIAEAWRAWADVDHRSVMLCTDRPQEADRFFNGAQR